MLSAKERGAGTAPNDNRRGKSYRSRRGESSLKLEIGELLFCLQFPVGRELSHCGWELLERRLRRRTDLVHAGGAA